MGLGRMRWLGWRLGRRVEWTNKMKVMQHSIHLALSTDYRYRSCQRSIPRCGRNRTHPTFRPTRPNDTPIAMEAQFKHTQAHSYPPTLPPSTLPPAPTNLTNSSFRRNLTAASSPTPPSNSPFSAKKTRHTTLSNASTLALAASLATIPVILAVIGVAGRTHESPTPPARTRQRSHRQNTSTKGEGLWDGGGLTDIHTLA